MLPLAQGDAPSYSNCDTQQEYLPNKKKVAILACGKYGKTASMWQNGGTLQQWENAQDQANNCTAAFASYVHAVSVQNPSLETRLP